MSKEHIVVIGGGFSGLKLVKLIMSSGKTDAEITLISSSSTFVFFPLVPDYIAGKIRKLNALTTDVPEFCKNLGVACIIEDCIEIDYEQKKVISKTGASIRYDRCIICTGKSGSDNHVRIWEFLNSLDSDVSRYRAEKMGLAEFEIMSALEEAGKNIIIHNYGKHKDLKEHWLRKTLAQNRLEQRYQQVDDYIRMNSIDIGWNSGKEVNLNLHKATKDILVIGAAMCVLDGSHSSAQKSSHDAHIIGYYIDQERAKGKCLRDQLKAGLNDYRSRGEMIFIHSNYALIWLGDKPREKATLTGVPASIIRRFFYKLEFWLYYQINGAPRTLCKFINRTRMLKRP